MVRARSGSKFANAPNTRIRVSTGCTLAALQHCELAEVIALRFTIIPALAVLGCTPLLGQALTGSMRSLGKLLADGSSPQSFPANRPWGCMNAPMTP